MIMLRPPPFSSPVETLFLPNDCQTERAESVTVEQLKESQKETAAWAGMSVWVFHAGLHACICQHVFFQTFPKVRCDCISGAHVFPKVLLPF